MQNPKIDETRVMKVTTTRVPSGQNRLLTGLNPVVRSALSAYIEQVSAALGSEVVSITLYGSQARGEAVAGSDIDLLVIIRQDSPGLRQALADLAWQVQYEHDVVISDLIRSAGQYKQMKSQGFPYYQSIQREGILLWKSRSEPTPAFG